MQPLEYAIVCLIDRFLSGQGGGARRQSDRFVNRFMNRELVAARVDRLELDAVFLTEVQFLAQLVDVLLDRALDDAGIRTPHRRGDLLARQEGAR